MSDLKMSLEEELSLTELFSNSENERNFSVAETPEDISSTSAENPEPNVKADEPDWKGVSLDEIYRHNDPFDWDHLLPIHPSATHTVLFQLPVINNGPPKPHPAQTSDQWSQNCVRMPYSSHSLYPINPENEYSKEFRRRWEVIQEALLQNFMSSQQLEAAILSYNYKYADKWKFSALHYFFNDYIDEEEMKMCLESLIPKMVQLALQLPDLVKGSIPLLKRQTNKSISLSQLQVASLLANAFFCTFPRRNSKNPESEYASFPHINFNRLFGALTDKRPSRKQAVMEKLKCIFHYFRRVTSKAPEGTITIERRYIAKSSCPRWDKEDVKLAALHIRSKGAIESEGTGLLQVDFANKFVGGGVLRFGCVQEEIRFVLCPELLVTMLVAESLDNTEALLVLGAERYSKYEGYGDNFSWAGDFVDGTPRDSSGRIKTCIVAIDALRFNQPRSQYDTDNLVRELNKAYVGFSSELASMKHLPAVATGNWGCGAFRGNPQLKVLLQLMAAAVAGRSVVYFTFGDTNLRDSIADIYWDLVEHNITVGRLFVLISQYQDIPFKKRPDFYRFLYNRSRIKSLDNYFHGEKKGGLMKPIKTGESNDSQVKYFQHQDKCTVISDFKKYASIAKLKEDKLEEDIEKWLEDVKDGTTGNGNLNEQEVAEEEEGKNVDKKADNGLNKQAVQKTSSSMIENQREVLSPIKKKKQTFNQLFGEELDDFPKKRITSLDQFDQLILEEAAKAKPHEYEQMDVDTGLGNQSESSSSIKHEAPTINKSVKVKKKEMQTTIHDYFKRKKG